MKAICADIPIATSFSPNYLPARQHRYFLRWIIFCCAFFAKAASPASAMSTNNISNSKHTGTTTATADVSAASSTIDFLTTARGLKTTPRTGWVLQKAGPRIESVADHSWRMSLMAMVAASCDQQNNNYDINRCIKIAMVHDLAEATVGDITPHCGVSDATKHDLELDAITKMTSKLALGLPVGAVGVQILDLWKEYEAGTTPEAKLVKDMDKLEMILQALEYETDGKNEKSLDGFFDSTRDKWRTPIGKAWGDEIEKRRPKHQKPKPVEEGPEVETNDGETTNDNTKGGEHLGA